MQESVTALFLLDFNRDLLLLQGLVYFALPMYWAYSLGSQLSPGRTWTAFSICCGLAYAVAAGMSWGMLYAGTAAAIGLCLTLALMNSTAATCLLASFMFLRPWELTTQGDQYLGMLPRLTFVVCVSHLILGLASQRKIAFTWDSVSLVLGGLGLWCFLSTLVAPDPGAAQGAFFDSLFKSLFLYFMLMQQIRSHAALRMLIVTLLFSFLTVATLAVYQTYGLGELVSETGYRLQGFGAFANANDIAAIMILILPFGAMLAARSGEAPVMRLLGLSVTLLALTAIFLSRSRGAIFGVVAILGILGLRKLGRRAFPAIAVACGLLAVGATSNMARESDDLEGSREGRVTYFKAGLRMGLLNPVGVGFDAFPQTLQRYSTESLEEGNLRTAHNSWVLVFAETGVIGLILFVTVFALSLRWAWEVFPNRPEFFLSMVGYGIAISFLSHSYLLYLYMLYGLVGIHHAAQAPKLAILEAFGDIRELRTS